MFSLEALDLEAVLGNQITIPPEIGPHSSETKIGNTEILYAKVKKRSLDGTPSNGETVLEVAGQVTDDKTEGDKEDKTKQENVSDRVEQEGGDRESFCTSPTEDYDDKDVKYRHSPNRAREQPANRHHSPPDRWSTQNDDVTIPLRQMDLQVHTNRVRFNSRFVGFNNYSTETCSSTRLCIHETN